jgi:hypothetical protein
MFLNKQFKLLVRLERTEKEVVAMVVSAAASHVLFTLLKFVRNKKSFLARFCRKCAPSVYFVW